MTKTQELEVWEYLAEGLRSHARTIDMECAPEDSDIWAAADALSAASATIKGLEERIEALMRERTSLNETKREQLDAQFRQHVSDLAHARGEIEAAEAERDALREALEPFANHLGRHGDIIRDLTSDDFRAARKAIEASK